MDHLDARFLHLGHIGLGAAARRFHDLHAARDDGIDPLGLAEGGVEAQRHEIGQERFGADLATHFLEHGRDVEAGAAESAIILGDQRSHDAQLGKPGPAFGVVERAVIGDLVAVLDRIGVGEVSERP